MSDIGVQQGCHLSPILFNLYIDALEAYWGEIDGDSLCSFNKMVVVLLYVDDVGLLVVLVIIRNTISYQS